MAENWMEPAPFELARHVRILGGLTVALAVFWLITAFMILVGTAFVGTIFNTLTLQPETAGAIAGIGTFVVIFLLIVAVPATLAGLALLRGQAHGRNLTFLIAAVALLNFPLGTGYALYAFWVLTRSGLDQVLPIAAPGEAT